MELAFHASMAGLTAPTTTLAIAQKQDAVNVVLLNVPPAKKVCG